MLYNENMEDPETTRAMDFLLPLIGLLIVIIAILCFAGYIVQAHEATIQHCITSGYSWQNESCIKGS